MHPCGACLGCHLVKSRNTKQLLNNTYKPRLDNFLCPTVPTRTEFIIVIVFDS